MHGRTDTISLIVHLLKIENALKTQKFSSFSNLKKSYTYEERVKLAKKVTMILMRMALWPNQLIHDMMASHFHYTLEHVSHCMLSRPHLHRYWQFDKLQNTIRNHSGLRTHVYICLRTENSIFSEMQSKGSSSETLSRNEENSFSKVCQGIWTWSWWIRTKSRNWVISEPNKHLKVQCHYECLLVACTPQPLPQSYHQAVTHTQFN